MCKSATVDPVPGDGLREASAFDVSRETSDAALSRDSLARQVSSDTLRRLDRYVALLLHWNRTVNLVSRGDEGALWSRHICDTAQLGALIPGGVGEAVDLGSGAGLPGLVLAVLTGVRFTLVEADRRKAAFLREAARITHAPVDVLAARVEHARVAPAKLVTARAFAPLPKLLSCAAPLLRPGGVCLFPKGENVESELTAARRQWHMKVERIPSRTAPGAVILMISEIQCAGAPERGAG